MAQMRSLLLLALCATAFLLVAAGDHHADQHAAPAHAAPAKTMLADVDTMGAEVVAPFSAMQYGILIMFVLMWLVYYIVYFFEYDSAGNSYLFSNSFIVLIILVASGLSRYFTGSILTAILSSSLLFLIAFSGFSVMMTITTPDRFEGDKSNMGRTRLE
eukprot:CAMPEP_0181310432 /NCGR_PEP_ID=MMETSP1101-20121128/12582_1 /TAXON_ID=46948 /ORGANISM="Rhodomonas abbreviata, Strain Caron Lab Isolate" /LENGTH=158 /DNA_ID=CAMNT_0023417059 /DNA_START=35 /DNA_END=511 /DNA_ORIENTATION=+